MSSARASKTIDQIAMTTVEILQDIAQLLRGSSHIEPKYPTDDMVGP